jgi:cell division protease FtsH
VTVSNGKVTEKKEYYLKNIGHYELEDFEAPDSHYLYNKIPKDVSFIPMYYHDIIYRLAKDKFQSMYDVSEFLSSMNGQDTVDFLSGLYEQSKHPKTVDCTKSFIFILGNLDEAYTMSHNFNPDMDADEFHAQSLTITVPAIKRALQGRFRSEQIARLGNTHIIYPAFSKDTFRKIIELELHKISARFLEKNGIDLKFDSSILELIFNEGVYPTQGTRPVYSTISRIVSSKLGAAVTEMILKELTPSQLYLSYSEGAVCVEYFQMEEFLHKLELRQELNLERLRHNRKDDVQAITAVHESGHAIVSAVLLNLFPEYILSTSAGSDNSGLIYAKLKWDFISKKEILQRLALFMGGFAAEKIVFGEENVTTGAEDDIEKATMFVMEMLKQCGMGEFPVCYHADDFKTRQYVYDENNLIGRQAEQFMKSALELAERTLREQLNLLLKLSDYLSDNRSMPKKEIERYFQLYGNNVEHLRGTSDDHARHSYREMLKKRIAESTASESADYIHLHGSCD